MQGQDISADDIRAELARIDATLTPGCIPLIWTGADEVIDDDDLYWKTQAGLSIEALHFLLDGGVKLIGIDAYALDVSHDTMQSAITGSDKDARFFPAHFVGREREHMHLEKLANLGALPHPTGFLFAAFPIKIRGGSAGWVRPVAMFPKTK
jgi:kynurenine formamidase